MLPPHVNRGYGAFLPPFGSPQIRTGLARRLWNGAVFNETSGNKIAILGQHSEIVGTLGSAVSRGVWRGLRFNGGDFNNCYVNVGTLVGPQNGFGMLIRLNQSVANVSVPVGAFNGGANNYIQFILIGDGNVHSRIWAANGSYIGCQTTSPIVANNVPVTLGFSWDGTLSSSGCLLYGNGRLLPTIADESSPGSFTPNTNACTFEIGRQSTGAAYTGDVEWFYMFDAPLSLPDAARITQSPFFWFNRLELTAYPIPISLIAVNASDSGAGIDASSLAVQIATSDVGAGLDASSILATLLTGDTSAGVDASGLNVLVSTGDTGVGVDTVAALMVLITRGDSGAGVDAVTLPTAIPGSDTGTGTETAAVYSAFTRAETGVATETSHVSVFLVNAPSSTRLQGRVVRRALSAGRSDVLGRDGEATFRQGEIDFLDAQISAVAGAIEVTTATFQLLRNGYPVLPPNGTVDYTTPLFVDEFTLQRANKATIRYRFDATGLRRGKYLGRVSVTLTDASQNAYALDLDADIYIT